MSDYKYYPQNVEALSNKEVIKYLENPHMLFGDRDDDEPTCSDPRAWDEFETYKKEALRVLDSRNIPPNKALRLIETADGPYCAWVWFFQKYHDLTPFSTEERQEIISNIRIEEDDAFIDFVSHGNFDLADDIYLLERVNSWGRSSKKRIAWSVQNFATKHHQHLTEKFLFDLISRYPILGPEIVRLKLLNKQQIATFVDQKIKSISDSDYISDPYLRDTLNMDDCFLAEIISQGLIDLDQVVALCLMMRRRKCYHDETMTAAGKMIARSDCPVEKIMDIASKIDSEYFNAELLKNMDLTYQKFNREQIFALARIVSDEKALMLALDTKKLNFEQRHELLEKAYTAQFAREFIAKGYALPDPK